MTNLQRIQDSCTVWAWGEVGKGGIDLLDTPKHLL